MTMEFIRPYSLTAEGSDSAGYYAAISAFTGRWQEQARRTTGEVADGFTLYRRRAGLAERSPDEYALELLALGVLLREHGEEAANLSGRSAWLLASLVRLQDRYPWAEQAIKALRGLVGGLRRIWHAVKGRDYHDVRAVEQMIAWLDAQGEAAQSGRYTEWLGYLASLPAYRARAAIRLCAQLAADFAEQSQAALGAYTREVDYFRTRMAPTARWRYDLNLLTRSRVEYHLGMLGTEVLNRAFRRAYAASQQRLVIVPPCLRARPDGECPAVQTPLGAQCQGCTPGCRVFQATQLGKRHGVMVVSIPDDALGQLCVSSGQAGSGLGVVGVACALRNWTAGWEAQRLGLHAQGVLLDYPGCKKHWNQEETPTDLNLKALEGLMEMKAGREG